METHERRDRAKEAHDDAGGRTKGRRPAEGEGMHLGHVDAHQHRRLALLGQARVARPNSARFSHRNSATTRASATPAAL
ncbi:hypothetical protein FBQ73_01545 [Xanthobacter autotrophicus]|uniref:Uncharacterized protein n=1 Tax=Xanthobacter autotrophicus TaxID=280 RepID=A0A6C1KLP9_XANAU|nr:hypothetical protein FBQ73_01545 [Xanthobacter autotrophicus]